MDRVAIRTARRMAIELWSDVAGQERAVWNPALSLPPTEFDLTDAEIARIKTALETRDAYGASTDRRWLEPLLDAPCAR